MSVAPSVLAKLLAPEERSGLRFGCETASRMCVPEATVNEYDCAVSSQSDVWSSRQIPSVQSEPKAPGVQPPPHNHLRAGMRLPDSRHVQASLRRCQAVHGSGTPDQVVDPGSNLPCQQWRHGVPNLVVLLSAVTAKPIAVWE